MINAIVAGTTTAGSASGTGRRASPALDAQLNSCRAQLEDWVTCPSAKTPEGKAKIKEITTRFDSIKHQIEQASQGAAGRSSNDRAGVVPTSQAAGREVKATSGALGTQLDLWA